MATQLFLLAATSKIVTRVSDFRIVIVSQARRLVATLTFFERPQSDKWRRCSDALVSSFGSCDSWAIVQENSIDLATALFLMPAGATCEDLEVEGSLHEASRQRITLRNIPFNDMFCLQLQDLARSCFCAFKDTSNGTRVVCNMRRH